MNAVGRTSVRNFQFYYIVQSGLIIPDGVRLILILRAVVIARSIVLSNSAFCIKAMPHYKYKYKHTE